MIVDDIIYGTIHLEGIYEKIANCEDFTRLQDITQTALTVIQYPELKKETRYEHSIGVYYLMNEAIEALEQKGIKISQREKTLAKVAALVHDIGHGVNSHLLEDLTGISHEQRGIDIIKDKTTSIHQIIVEEYGKDFIEELTEFLNCIYGQGSFKESIELRKDGTIPLKQVIATLISHNIDVDRLDYLTRESTYTGFGTLTDYRKVIKSFECSLIGNNIILTIPQEKMHLIESSILERVRNYQHIYYADYDFIGNHAFELLLKELRKHPEEVPQNVSKATRKFLTQEKACLTNKEYMQLTNTPLNQAIDAIRQTTKNEKIRYLCDYEKIAKQDYQILYNGRSENYLRNLLSRVIPEFTMDSNSLFERFKVIKPYKKTKFGSTMISTPDGIQRFEDLPHNINLNDVTKKVMAINPEILRLETGMSKEEFTAKYADILQEIMLSQEKPTQEFELKYAIAERKGLYTDIVKFLQSQYKKQDSSTYMSKDMYYDDIEEGFKLLEQGETLRIRVGITCHQGMKSREYKNRRITYKRQLENEQAVTYMNRNKTEELGVETDIHKNAEFLQAIGVSQKVGATLEVNNLRKLVTILVNGEPIDISFNLANYENYIYGVRGNLNSLEIRPRNNQISGRLALLEIKRQIEEAFPELKGMISSASAYEVAMIDSYDKHRKLTQDATAKRARKDTINSAQITGLKFVTTLNEVIQKVKAKRTLREPDKQEVCIGC